MSIRNAPVESERAALHRMYPRPPPCVSHRVSNAVDVSTSRGKHSDARRQGRLFFERGIEKICVLKGVYRNAYRHILTTRQKTPMIPFILQSKVHSIVNGSRRRWLPAPRNKLDTGRIVLVYLVILPRSRFVQSKDLGARYPRLVHRTKRRRKDSVQDIPATPRHHIDVEMQHPVPCIWHHDKLARI